MKTNIKQISRRSLAVILALMTMFSTMILGTIGANAADFTFAKDTIIYYDFSALTSGTGVNYNDANGNWTYNTTDAGNIVEVKYTKDKTFNNGDNLYKISSDNWANHPITDRGSNNMVVVAADGSYTWSTYGPDPTPTGGQTIYFDATNFGSTSVWVSVQGSGNTSKNMTKSDTSGAGSYVPKNDTWYQMTKGEGNIYSVEIPGLSADTKITFWNKDESTYSNVWQAKVATTTFDGTNDLFTISSGSTNHSDRQTDCYSGTWSTSVVLEDCVSGLTITGTKNNYFLDETGSWTASATPADGLSASDITYTWSYGDSTNTTDGTTYEHDFNSTGNKSVTVVAHADGYNDVTQTLNFEVYDAWVLYYFKSGGGANEASLNSSEASVELDGNATYYFKYYKTNGNKETKVWYGCQNSGAKMTESNSSDWQFTTTNGGHDCGLQTTVDGTYKFKIGKSDAKVTVTYPTSTTKDYYITGRFEANDKGIDWDLTSREFKFTQSEDNANQYYYVTDQTVKALSEKRQCSSYSAYKFFMIYDGTTQYNASATDLQSKKGYSNAATLGEKTNNEAMRFSDTTDTSGPVTIWMETTDAGVPSKIWYTVESSRLYIDVYVRNGAATVGGYGTSKAYAYDDEAGTIGAEITGGSDLGTSGGKKISVADKSSIVVKTTMDSTKKDNGYYVDYFVANGVKYTAVDAGSGVYESAPIPVTDTTEIIPVYANSNFEYITLYVQSSDAVFNDWGNTIAVYAWYSDTANSNVKEYIFGYPGQPLGLGSSGYYEGKVPKYNYNTDGSKVDGSLVKGLTVSNMYENDSVHAGLLKSGQQFNLQTYDYDDFKVLAENNYDTVRLELKYFNGNTGSGHSKSGRGYNKYTNTNQYKFGDRPHAADYETNNNAPQNLAGASLNNVQNPFERLYDFDGNTVSVTGEKTNLKYSDKSAVPENSMDIEKAAVKIVSIGNQDSGTVGDWATVWYVFDATNGNLITKGYPSDFIKRTGDDATQTAAYTAVHDTIIGDTGLTADKFAAAISYESEQGAYYSHRTGIQYSGGDGETGIRMDGRWLYATADAPVNSNIKIMYTTGAVSDSTVWSEDTIDSDDITVVTGPVTGADAYFASSTVGTDAHARSATTPRNSVINTVATNGNGYAFVGWYSPIVDANTGVITGYQLVSKLKNDKYTAATDGTLYAMYAPQAGVHVKTGYLTPSDDYTDATKFVSKNWTIESATGLLGGTTGASASATFTKADTSTVTSRDIDDEELTIGSTVTLAADATKNNYTLQGWYTLENGVYTPITNQAEYTLAAKSATLFALYVQQNATANVKVESRTSATADYADAQSSVATATINDGSSVTAAVGTTLNLATTKNDADYSFDGWYVKDGSEYTLLTENATIDPQILKTSGLTYVARYTKIATHPVKVYTRLDGETVNHSAVGVTSYYINGTVAVTPSLTVNEGSSVHVENPSYNSAAYNFEGYYNQDGTPFTDILNVSDDVTVIAKYTTKPKNTVTVKTAIKYFGSDNYVVVDDVIPITYKVEGQANGSSFLQGTVIDDISAVLTDEIYFTPNGLYNDLNKTSEFDSKTINGEDIVIYDLYEQQTVRVTVLTQLKNSDGTYTDWDPVNQTVNTIDATENSVEVAKGSLPEIAYDIPDGYYCTGVFAAKDEQVPYYTISEVKTDITLYIVFERSNADVNVTVKYYERIVQNGKPVDINKTPTTFDVTINVSTSTTYNGLISAIANEINGKVVSISDTYSVVTGNDVFNTHNNWYGFTADDSEKWFDFGGRTLTTADLNSAIGDLTNVTLWLKNDPREYTVSLVYPTSVAEIESKDIGDYSSQVYQSYYNTRLGQELGDFSDAATAYLNGHNFSGTKQLSGAELYIPPMKIGDYTFAYWSTDKDGKNVASTSQMYAYRIVNDITLYAIYKEDAEAEKGVSIIAGASDHYNSNGEKIRVNDIVVVYGYETKESTVANYDDINKAGLVYVQTDRDLTAAEIEKIQKAITEEMASAGTSNRGKDVSIDGVATKGYFAQYYTVGTGAGEINLTNKNRVQLTFSASEAKFTNGGTYSNLYVFAVANAKLNGEDTFFVSSDYVHYVDGEPK